MISKSQQKYIRSLEHKKYRRKEGVFVAEGVKTVGDLMMVIPVKEIYATHEWMTTHTAQIPHEAIVHEITDAELERLSFQQHPQQVLALFPLPDPAVPSNLITGEIKDKTLVLALDGVQDPGNLGTIIRIADWFGINTIICSTDTADAYNPKVIQATMGSIARTNIIYTDLLSFIDQLPHDYPIYGTLLDGQDIYQQQITPYGLIIMGNEGRGISAPIAERVNHRLLIPNFPEGRPTADSLNVAIATAITCAEFRRIAKL